MPVGFTMAIVFAVAMAVSAVLALVAPRSAVKRTAALAALALLAGTLLLGITSSAHSVPIRSVGIVTSFGKPTGEVTGSGLKWVAPWQKVGEWDAGRQKYDHIGGNSCVRVRTGTLADACVEVLIEWQVKPENAPKQFMDYKETSTASVASGWAYSSTARSTTRLPRTTRWRRSTPRPATSTWT
ncbi:hypothetical protein GCM10027614_76380 [Micromonospora vulcania]